jgi:hypothetical protein
MATKPAWPPDPAAAVPGYCCAGPALAPAAKNVAKKKDEKSDKKTRGPVRARAARPEL